MLDGIYISKFRNFGDEEQFVGPLSSVNIFIGGNNSGKSNALRYIRDILKPFLAASPDKHPAPIPSVSRPRFGYNESAERKVVVRTDEATIENHFGKTRALPRNWREWFKSHPLDIDRGDLFAISCVRENRQLVASRGSVPKSGVDHRLTQDIWHGLLHRQGGSFENWHLELLNALIQRSAVDLDYIYIPSFRQIETKLDEFTLEYRKATGDNHIIEQLSELAYPPYDKQELKDEFEKLRNFIGVVLDCPHISIEIPHDRTTINVRTDNSVLPLEALGSGVHELFMLASLIVLNRNQIILLEEPEVHMHPALQRKLMAFIADQAGTQFFITTHSAHVIDTKGSSIFGVRSENGIAKVEPLLTDQSKRRMCEELGYHPSDLLQSNCVIWVEGPSDRIYLLHWLGLCDPDLKEGIHFSVMFYGGKLLSHLSAADASMADFIALLPINRHPAVVMDSDRGAASQQIRSTKARVQEELQVVGGYCWITAGREIENYIPADARLRAVQAAHKPARSLAGGTTRFSKPLDFLDESGNRKMKGFDKVGIASAAVSAGLSLDSLDLRERMSDLAKFVRLANGTTS